MNDSPTNQIYLLSFLERLKIREIYGENGLTGLHYIDV